MQQITFNKRGSTTSAFMRGELEILTEEQKKQSNIDRGYLLKEKNILDLIRRRNQLIRNLHAFYKYTFRELAAAFRLSKSGVGHIISHREEFGAYKPCKVCRVTMWQGNLNWRAWGEKKYCCSFCKEQSKRQRKKR